MDRLRAIEYFVCTADAGSISAAADTLGVSVAAVSKSLGALEARLRVSLFTRGPRGIVLTRDGEAYLARCRRILSEVDSAEAALSSPTYSPRGTLVVGLPPLLAAYCIAPALGSFRSRFPDIAVHLRRAYRDTEPFFATLDALVMLGWPSNEDAVALHLAETRFLICAAPAYWASAGIPDDPSQLAAHDCLVYRTPEEVAMEVWTFARNGNSQAVSLKPKVIGDEQGWLIAQAVSGAGVVRTIDLTVREHLKRGELIPVLLDWTACEAPPVHIIYRKVQRRNERVGAFVQFLRELFSELEATRLPRTSASLSPATTGMPEWWGRNRLRRARYRV